MKIAVRVSNPFPFGPLNPFEAHNQPSIIPYISKSHHILRPSQPGQSCCKSPRSKAILRFLFAPLHWPAGNCRCCMKEERSLPTMAPGVASNGIYSATYSGVSRCPSTSSLTGIWKATLTFCRFRCSNSMSRGIMSCEEEETTT